jgi:hypothetical protein
MAAVYELPRIVTVKYGTSVQVTKNCDWNMAAVYGLPRIVNVKYGSSVRVNMHVIGQKDREGSHLHIRMLEDQE